MSEDYGICELAVVSLRDNENEPDYGIQLSHEGHINTTDMRFKQPEDSRIAIFESKFGYNNGTTNVGSSTGASGTGGDVKVCAAHGVDVDRYCRTEGRAICEKCVSQGPCQNHTVIHLHLRATAVRNQLVDVCETMQLQALQIERFINNTLSAKEKALQTEASSSRERVVAQVNVVREALDEEEQRLLEAVQREEERIEQCLLTQRAHWSKALNTLTHARTSLVHMLTNSTDIMLVNKNSEISDRIEEAEGVGLPKDSEHLNMNRDCSDSKLMLGMWASALLLGTTAAARMYFDERTVSHLLLLSSDRLTLTYRPKKQKKPILYDPARFDHWPNALCLDPISSGTHTWVMYVGDSAAFKVGICYRSMERKGSSNESRLGFNAKSWVLSHYEGNFSYCHNGRVVNVVVVKSPTKVGMLLDWNTQTLLFYDPDSKCVLHAVRETFTEPLLPACAVADQSISIVHC
ncbi:B box and SPRY domain-containing protein [Tachysurus fulvidraco]|uniref:B box and SPRY domain-containing protein n=1 Tax=Tachysurus fulvidraco TaxID=1234273 RepID=UPI001FEF3B70|nr:B box and SPRY domain-containing protein [Tachysurus fulvidraco]